MFFLYFFRSPHQISEKMVPRLSPRRLFHFPLLKGFLLYASWPAYAGTGDELSPERPTALEDGPKSGLLSSKQVLEPPPRESLWTFGVGYSHRFQLQANFRNLGGRVAGLPVPSPGNSVFGDYDDGFVREDISGLSTSTTFWEYTDGSQYDPAGGGFLDLSIRDIPGTASDREREDAGGVDFFVRRDIGDFSARGHQFQWGWQARLNYTPIDIASRQSLSLEARETTDRFPFTGVIPPLAPYTGSFGGPGPLLNTGATRSIGSAAEGALVTGSRRLEADLFALSLGPWLEISPTPRLSLQLEGGLNLALIDGRYSQQSVTSSGPLMATVQSNGSDHELAPGFYLGGGASYRLRENLEVYFSARYEYLDDFSIDAGSSSAELSFDDSFMISTGLFFSF